MISHCDRIFRLAASTLIGLTVCTTTACTNGSNGHRPTASPAPSQHQTWTGYSAQCPTLTTQAAQLLATTTDAVAGQRSDAIIPCSWKSSQSKLSALDIWTQVDYTKPGTKPTGTSPEIQTLAAVTTFQKSRDKDKKSHPEPQFHDLEGLGDAAYLTTNDSPTRVTVTARSRNAILEMYFDFTGYEQTHGVTTNVAEATDIQQIARNVALDVISQLR